MKKFMKFVAKFVALAALIIPLNSFAQSGDNVSKDNKTETVVIGNVMSNGVSNAGVILVDKSAKKMFNVKITDDKIQVVDEFPIMYGSSLGDKMFRGDNKTPEGVYYITTYRSSEHLLRQYGDYAKIYGVGSFPLNYPNPVDRLKKKTGSGIWIHGINPSTDKESTQGCVALRNEDFNTLKENAEVKYPVIITENLTYLSENEYKDLKKKITDRFDGFINAWGGSDYNVFKTYVHEDYKSVSGQNSKSYLENKRNLMRIYPTRAVVTSDVKVFMKDPGYVVFDTEQFYCAPNLVTLGEKKYYFEGANDGELKLISEEFVQRDATPFITDEIVKFVNGWGAAWENQQLEPYMSYYSKSFSDGKIGKYDDWSKYKKNLFDMNKTISVQVSNISWTKTSRGYSVTFVQDYSSDKINDRGRKTLLLSGCPTQFEIISETWKPL